VSFQDRARDRVNGLAGLKEFGVQRGVAELKKTRIRNTPVLQACFDPLFDPLGSIGPSAAGSTAGDYQL